MEMGSSKEIRRIEPQGEIYKCPSCGYQDGFHLSFRLDQEASGGEVYLICPNCHSRFRMGWKVSVSSTGMKEGVEAL